MKKLLPCFLAIAVSATLAFGEGSTDSKQVGDLSVGQLHAVSIDAGSIVFPYSRFVATTPATTTQAAVSVVSAKMASNGVWVVSTNTLAGSTNTSANVIGSAQFLGKIGCLVAANATGLTVTVGAPGSTLQYVTRTNTFVHSYMNSNGVFVTTTNLVAGITNSVASAPIGSIFTIVNGGTNSFTLSSGTTLWPASQSVTVATNSAIPLVAISGAYWLLGDVSQSVSGATRTYANVVYGGGASTGNFTFVSGLLQ